uniref:Golgi to ER traffic protein 4 homolog n=1 Tax=Elaeophora elaphi TaxID=1147741 RepID=A0A0R3RVH3_9BILA
MSRVEEKLRLCFQYGNYYEAHQIYRTIYNRLANQGKWQELQDVLYNGILRLLEEAEVASAIDLAELFVEALEKSKTSVSSAVLDRFDELLNLLPAHLEKDLQANSEREDRRLQYISLGIKWTMAVAEKKRYRRRGHPGLHFRIAKALWREGNYASARNHFMYSDNPETFAMFLTEYQLKYGYTTEKDLFIAQAVLQMLCDRRLKSALKLLESYADIHPDIRSGFPYPFPLLNFLHYAIICIANKQLAYFTVLVEQYGNEISRDPEYKHLLDKIAQIYMRAPRPQAARGGFLGNMIKGLLRSPENESGTAEESETDPEEMLSIPFKDEYDKFSVASTSRLTDGVFQTDAAQDDLITDDMDLD